MAKTNNQNLYKYIITETTPPTSLDPLDADQTQNLPAARMVYATPIEIDHNDKMSSLVLEKFSYSPETKTIKWFVKDNISYSNGEKITTDDIAFSVARMAFTRPLFPVIDKIKGLKDWVQKPNALESLPSGISVKGNEISIVLDSDVEHPLFRFTLELFSIIPKRCVDLKKNKIVCDPLPTSGRYAISKKTEDSITFVARASDSEFPANIKFEYLAVNSILNASDNFDEFTVLAGNEVMYSANIIEKLKTAGKISYLPASRFAALAFNPEVDPFKEKLCRQVFAEKFRQYFSKVSQSRNINEGSIFTSLIPGHMTLAELSENEIGKITDSQTKDCLSKIQKSNFSWGYVESEKNSEFVMSVSSMLEAFGLNKPPMLFKDRKEQVDAYQAGKIAFISVGSGFWALDPSGDLQMLFTPNLHKSLAFVSRDTQLQTYIRNVVGSPESKKAYKEVNQYLYNQSIFNVYTHVRRFYFSKNKKFMSNSQLGFSAPSPWQVFNL